MPSPREQPPTPGNRRRRQDAMPGGWLWLLILILLVGVLYFAMGIGNGSQIGYSDFMSLVEQHQVDTVQIVGNRIEGELKENPKDNPKLSDKLKGQIRGKVISALIPESETRSGGVTEKLTK